MKAKDIIVIIVCVIVIGGCIYFLLSSLNPKVPESGETTSQSEEVKFKYEINEDIIKKVEKRTDYGLPKQDNIGRPDPFAGI